MDLRQTNSWAQYLSSINWTIEKLPDCQIFIRKIPLLPFSIIKIQRPKNPPPFYQINSIAKKYHALFILLEPDHLNFNEKAFKTAGYQRSKMIQAHTATIQINVPKTEKMLLKSLSENARRNIKKALKNNLIIRKIDLKNTTSTHGFERFYQLLQNITKIKKFYIPGYEEFYKKMLAFKNNSYLFNAFEKDSEDPIASLWLATSNNTAHYMHVGTSQKGYNLLANYLLVWETLKFAQKNGLKIYDFEGTFDPRFPKERRSWIGFTEFKKRFHGQFLEYPYPQIKFYNLFFQLFYLCSKIFIR